MAQARANSEADWNSPGKKQEAKNFFQNRLHWTSNRHHWQTRMEAKQAFYWTIIPKSSRLTNENAEKCENVADKARTIPPASNVASPA
jgi:hypothetical protein